MKITSKKKTNRVIEKRKKKSQIPLTLLPQDVIAEISMLLASSSSAPLNDIKNLRSTCKSLLNASKERKVGRAMAVEKEESLSWWDNETYLTLLRQCARCGNMQASFLLALDEFYKRQRLDVGMLHLEDAARAGNRTAEYLMGMIFFREATTRALGVTLLNKLSSAATSPDDSLTLDVSRVVVCRKEASTAVMKFWMRKPAMLVREGPMPPCRNSACGKIKDSGLLDTRWFGSDAERRTFCSHLCMWNHEFSKFIELL